MGPHTYERDHSRVNGTTHFWTKPVDYHFTNGGPFTPDGLFIRGGTDYTCGGPRTANTLPMNGMSTCDRVYV